jgi:hypothetical protein
MDTDPLIVFIFISIIWRKQWMQEWMNEWIVCPWGWRPIRRYWSRLIIISIWRKQWIQEWRNEYILDRRLDNCWWLYRLTQLVIPSVATLWPLELVCLGWYVQENEGMKECMKVGMQEWWNERMKEWCSAIILHGWRYTGWEQPGCCGWG